ncbi:MAG: NDP-hexose 2,3-dehydratase family protein [Oscillospiraceae bacterium]|nr:NDP-hexose 2,3-dehydratase family protein [Oscillospiraceae bacterium]
MTFSKEHGELHNKPVDDEIKAILTWVSDHNKNLQVDIKKTTLDKSTWFYDNDTGSIVNKNRTFFQIRGIKYENIAQPIIIQDEIGYLGILCKSIKGVLHYLLQAKIEPGNINKIQISPTIQATLSNFTQAHGGAKPKYLDYFVGDNTGEVIVDQIQSEQSSRFVGKRNRNIIIKLDEKKEIDVSTSHMWMTLSQIKKLMLHDNLVNMDVRTVLSCMPYYKYEFDDQNSPLIRSVKENSQQDILPDIYRYLNNHKMFSIEKPILVPLYSLPNWQTVKKESYEEFSCISSYHYKVIFCDISIEGREVRHWGQPLFEALGMATFGLFTRVNNGIQEYLVKAKAEIGCFDKIELGPTIQMESTEKPKNDIEHLFFNYLNKSNGVIYNVISSEEGGRFYYEENRNVIIQIEANAIDDMPPGYWWCTYRTLNKLVQVNNVLNIQLRNLLSLLEIK